MSTLVNKLTTIFQMITTENIILIGLKIKVRVRSVMIKKIR